MKVILAV